MTQRSARPSAAHPGTTAEPTPPLVPVSCNCAQCQAMCNSSTCLPTPQEARELLRRGYAERLATYRFMPDPAQLAVLGPAPRGQEGAEDLPHTQAGPCTFFHNGLCELHDLRLKPLEGRLAHHSIPWQPVRMHLLSHWKGRQFDSVTTAWRRQRRALRAAPLA
jgi:hypothetical protein